MPNKNVFEEMRDFQDKYGFSETFDELETKGRATAGPFAALDSFLWTSSEISYESRQYLHGLTYMLNKYVDNNLKPIMDSKKVYSLGNLNVLDFVNEYEKIVQMKHEAKNPNTPRKPYDGIEIAVLKTVENFSKNLNKPLVDVWADKIEKETYSISDLREQTKLAGNLSGKAHIKTVAMIHKAMEKIADERSIGWKLNPLNWPRMFQEYRYRNELSSILKQNKENHLKVREELTEDRSTLMLDPKMSEDIEKYRELREKEIQAQKEKELQTKLENEAADKSKLTVPEAADDLSKDSNVKEAINKAPAKELDNSRKF
jgi:hypothetical protein